MALEPQIFSGSSSRQFAQRVCGYLGAQLGDTTVITFEEGNTFVKFGQSVRDKEVYLIQSVGGRPNDDFMEILFWVDAMKRASASSSSSASSIASIWRISSSNTEQTAGLNATAVLEMMPRTASPPSQATRDRVLVLQGNEQG